MLAFYRPKSKPVFGIHDPVGLRYLFQLRLGLSHLRSHKIRHGFTDISSDLCFCQQAAEDSYQFLLKCSFYNTQRATLINDINPVLLRNNLNYPVNFPSNELNLLLYGHPSISLTDNTSILLSTINYIKYPGRFSN